MKFKTIITFALVIFVVCGLVVAISNSSNNCASSSCSPAIATESTPCSGGVCEVKEAKHGCSGNCSTCTDKVCQKTAKAPAAAENTTVQPAKEPATAEAKAPVEDNTTLIAYYFHGNKRCITCKKLEEYTFEAIKSNFADELKNGKILLKVVNTDLPENAHFVTDFKLFSKSVVLVSMKDNKMSSWRNLDKIWQLVKNKDSFMSYITSNTKSMLEEKS